MDYIFVDKYGWPIEKIKGRWFFNFVRVLIHARGIKRKSDLTTNKASERGDND